jgi:SAM-dependent methyltransferase
MNMLIDPIRIFRAVVTNFIAYVSPTYYLAITKQTGRGSSDTAPVEIADYFYKCFEDYMSQLSIPLAQETEFLKGKTLLEYGPGDTPGVALVFYAFGAESVVLVDRFSMLKLNEQNRAIITALIDKLPGMQKTRALEAFKVSGDVTSGFKEDVISYRTHPKGLSCLNESIDLIYSRAVLEHVDDLDASFSDMYNALKPNGLAVHQVDLKSHGLHKSNPLDFLVWPAWLWRLMYSGKGVPNRLRLDKYREVAGQSGMQTLKIEHTATAAWQDIIAVKGKLAPLFSRVSDEDLSCLGFWMHLNKPIKPA